MPWLKIDDASHSHPKFLRAGNAALGLWLRCGAWSAQHLTEGYIPATIAKAFGTPAQIRKLIAADLWHAAGHGCERCPQPGDGYMVHDFFEGGRNTTKAQHEANKKSATERAAKSRSARKAPQTERDLNANGVRNESILNANGVQTEPLFQGSTPGQQGPSQRTPADGVTHTHAGAMPYPSTSYGSTGAAAARDRPVLPDQLAELKQAIAAAGLQGVAWDLRDSAWEYTRQAITRVGIPAMAAMAINSARLKGTPAGASAWVQGWRSLVPAPDTPGITYLPAVASALLPVGRQQQETNDMFDRAMERARNRMTQEET